MPPIIAVGVFAVLLAVAYFILAAAEVLLASAGVSW